VLHIWYNITNVLAGALAGGGSSYAGISGTSVAGPSPSKRHPLGGLLSSPTLPTAAGSTPGYGIGEGAHPYGLSSGTSASDYVHYEVTQLPSRPLPAVITPADLRPTPKEKVEIRVIRYLLFSYLQIVKKTYQDMVPKVVMNMLVQKSRDEITSQLVHRLYSLITGPDILLRGALFGFSVLLYPSSCYMSYMLQKLTKWLISAGPWRITCNCSDVP
jgi:hypothetical protein